MTIWFSHVRNVSKYAIRGAVLGMAWSLLWIGSVQANDLTAEQVLTLVNAERSTAGLVTLSVNSQLKAAAEAKLADMFAQDYFSHTSPKGETPWAWVKRSGYVYQYAGENLAINYETAEKQHQAWMKSTTHKGNILNTRYQETGIAVTTGKMNGEMVTITVQLFGTPRGGAVNQSPKKDLSVTSEALVPRLVPSQVIQVVAIPETRSEPLSLSRHTNASLAPVTWWQVNTVPYPSVASWVLQFTSWLKTGAFLALLVVVLAGPTVMVAEACKHIGNLLKSRWVRESQSTQSGQVPLISATKRPLVT